MSASADHPFALDPTQGSCDVDGRVTINIPLEHGPGTDLMIVIHNINTCTGRSWVTVQTTSAQTIEETKMKRSDIHSIRSPTVESKISLS